MTRISKARTLALAAMLSSVALLGLAPPAAAQLACAGNNLTVAPGITAGTSQCLQACTPGTVVDVALTVTGPPGQSATVSISCNEALPPFAACSATVPIGALQASCAASGVVPAPVHGPICRVAAATTGPLVATWSCLQQ